MKTFLSNIIILLCICVSSSAQTWDEIRNNRTEWLYGEGYGSSAKEADNNALQNLASQIKVQVSSQLEYRSEKVQTGTGSSAKVEATDALESVIKSYSEVTLNNCRRLIISNGPREYHYVRYIRKDEIAQMFALREAKIKYMLDVAQKAEQERKLDAALKNYYWANILLRTLPEPSRLQYTDKSGEQHFASVWVPQKISGILSGIQFEYLGKVEDDESLGRLAVTYEGEPVTSLDYTYMDGVSWSILTSVKDGLGILEFRKNVEVSSVSIMVEYQYDNECHQDPEMESILDAMSAVNFPEAYKSNVSLKVLKVKSTQKPARVARERAIGAEVLEYPDFAALSDEEQRACDLKVQAILKAIRGGAAEAAMDYFTPEGYDAYSRLLLYGKAKVVDAGNLHYMKFGDDIYCRSVTMSFAFQTNDKHFVEDVIFVFDSTAKVCGINFALEQSTVQDILDKSQWRDEEKMIIINFLESYKTAFALMNVDYLSSIFSDDALIITGRVVQRVVVENQVTLQKQYIEYNRQSKQEYMANLRRSFASKEYVNLKFSNIDIGTYRKDGGLYGIQLKQDYYSSNYGDSGYLYLYVDMRDAARPIIHIRTWQPEPNPDVDSVTGLYGPWNF